MRRTSVVSAMVRSSGAIILLTAVLVVVLPIERTSAYTVERAATVELLPNDLISEDRERDEANKVIATPKQVIENQVSKTWKTIVRQMLDDTTTGLKQKRTVSQLGSALVVVELLLLCRKMALAGLIPPHPLFNFGRQGPLNAVYAAAPEPVSDIVSYPAGGVVPDLSATNNVVPGAPDVQGMIPTGGGGILPGRGSPIPGGLAGEYLNPVSPTENVLPVAGAVPYIPDASAAHGMIPSAGGLPVGGSSLTGAVAGTGTLGAVPYIPDASAAHGMIPSAGGLPVGGSSLTGGVAGTGTLGSAVPSTGAISGGVAPLPIPAANPAGSYGLL
ncbi:elastin-like [Anopheles marshallii]|uniref:elastin-like n=1 Tax=Anopheles marshallii TaxID=1521116 RepID=UPI00237A8477|nr:elastin-like [Anopheles marshallii]